MAKGKNILITGVHDFIAPYLYREFHENVSSETRVWMLGRGELAGINVDLAAESPQLPCHMDLVVHVDGTDSGSFDAARALDAARGLVRSLHGDAPRSLVYLSSSIVYGVESGESIGEGCALSPSRRDAMAKRDVEGFLSRWCAENGVALAILRPAQVVGTGMGGELRRLVNRIYRGTYRHITDNKSRISVVHAVDVARAVRLAEGHDGVWNLTDGVDPTRYEFVEALAWRLKHKRVYSLSRSHARVLARIGDYIPFTGFTTHYFDTELSTLTFDGSGFCELTGFAPQSVTEYLRTHDYNESSL